MPVGRFKYNIRKPKDVESTPGGYHLDLMCLRPDGAEERRDRREVNKLGAFGQFNISLAVSELAGGEFWLRVTRRNGVGGTLQSDRLRLRLPPTTNPVEADFGSLQFFDGEWKITGRIEVSPESGLVPEGLRVQVEIRSGILFEEPLFVPVSAASEFVFDGWRMLFNPENELEHLLRVFTGAGIDVGRHYRQTQPGVHGDIRIVAGNPFLDVWGEFRSTHPKLASKLERMRFDPKRAHKADDTFLLFRRYDIQRPYQVAEGVVIMGKRGPVGDPDWVWNINLDAEYEHLGNEKNRTKHGGLHVEACRSLSRERLPDDGLAATHETVGGGERVWMLGTHVYDDAWDFGSPDHEHFELHPLYVMQSCMGGWFHFAVYESIALAAEAASAGAPGGGWPRTSMNATDYRKFYFSEPDPRRRSEPRDWKFELAQTYGIICGTHIENGNLPGLANFFADTSVRYDSYGVDSGLPGVPDRDKYLVWANERIKLERKKDIENAIVGRLMSLHDFLAGPPSHGLEPLSGPAPQSVLRCVYARENAWAAEATGGAFGESNPRVALNRATARSTEAVRAELAVLYRQVFESAANGAARGRRFAEAIVSYRNWSVRTNSPLENASIEELRAHGSASTVLKLVPEMALRVDQLWNDLRPYRAL